MSVKSLINFEYEALAMTEDQVNDFSSTSPVTVRLLQQDVHMLQALADLFGKSRSAFGADLLEQSILEAFSYLSPEDREKVAEKADKALQGSNGHWSNQAHAQNQKAAHMGSQEAA